MGAETTFVSSGAFVPVVELLATADPATKRKYSMARTQYSRSTVAGFVSMAAFVGTIVHYGTGGDWRTVAGIGLPTTTLVSWFSAAGFGMRAENHMREAIWSYNGNLFSERPGPPPTCSYRSCAIRIKGSRIVRGEDGVLVGGVASRPVAELLSSAPDSGVRSNFQDFLATRRRSSVVGLVVLGAIVAGSVVLGAGEGETAKTVGISLLGVGYAVGHMNMAGPQREAAHLEQAVWRYNRQFSQPD